jgi:bifunctional polynucleotide phosphatase/kinase
LQRLYNEAIQQGVNIIVDNTNPDVETRHYYIDLAKRQGYKVYCYFFDFPKILSRHLNQMRAQITHCQTNIIPLIAIHTYYKKLVQPSVSEGIDKLITVKRLHTPIEHQELFNKYYNYHYDLK